MKNPEKNNNTSAIDAIKQEEWSLMPYGKDRYWIVHKNNGKTTFIAAVEDSGNDARNKAVAMLLSNAPQLLEMMEALYDTIKSTALGKTILFYMIKKIITEIKEYEYTRSIGNA